MEDILPAYGLNEEEVTVSPIQTGLINNTWRVKGEHFDYILQKLNTNVFKNPYSISNNISKISAFLKKNFPEYLFTHVLATNAGEELLKVDGNGYYRVTRFVPDSHSIDTVQNTKQAFEAACQFGKFTRLLADFPIQELEVTIPDFHNLSLRYRQFENAIGTGNSARIEKSSALIRFLTEHNNIVETYEQILENKEFKLRVTHHDTKISNVLFNHNDDSLCVIDLDTVMPGYFISDVGDMMRTYLSPVSEEEKDFSKIVIRDDYYRSIRKGYLSQMGDELSATEKDHFTYSGKFIIYMQALRFLTDYLNNDEYYGSKYEDQNYVRAGNQATLLERLLEKEDTL